MSRSVSLGPSEDGEGRGEVEDSRALAISPPYPPIASRWAAPSPPEGRRGALSLASRSGHRLDALDQVGELAAVLVPDRLDRVAERLLVLDWVDLDAGGLHAVHGLGLGLVPALARVELRLPSELFDQRLIVLGQLVPADAREHQHLRHDQVLA